jgi:hypothetical protein
MTENTVESAQDEWGNTRYFVCNSKGHWVGDVYDTAEEASKEASRLNKESHPLNDPSKETTIEKLHQVT